MWEYGFLIESSLEKISLGAKGACSDRVKKGCVILPFFPGFHASNVNKDKTRHIEMYQCVIASANTISIDQRFKIDPLKNQSYQASIMAWSS